MKTRRHCPRAACTPIWNLITSYVEGQLGPEEERIVAAHIDRCPECRSEFKNSLFLTRLLKENLSIPEPPDDLAAAVVKTVAPAKKP